MLRGNARPTGLSDGTHAKKEFLNMLILNLTGFVPLERFILKGPTGQ